MKMKKLLALAMAGVCAFTMVACSSSKTSSEKEPAKTEAKAENTATSDTKGIELNVSAAASLKDALEKINEKYKEQTGNTIILNLAASGTLVKQIQEGAPADLFISASKKKMTELVEKGLVEEGAVSNLLANDLVMVVPKDNKAKIEEVEDIEKVDGKIAVGEPETVPAGQYAKDSLTALGLWDKIQDKIVFAKDVRETLSYVEKGEVVAGFVYASDAVVSKDSKVAQVIDESTHKPIVYPIAVIKASKNMEEIKKYEEFLKSEESMKIFEEFGFKVAK